MNAYELPRSRRISYPVIRLKLMVGLLLTASWVWSLDWRDAGLWVAETIGATQSAPAKQVFRTTERDAEMATVQPSARP